MIFSDFIELHRGYDLPKAKRNADGLVPVIAAGGYDGFHDAAKVQGPGVITGRSGTLGSIYFNTTDFWPLNTTLFVSNFKGNDPLFVYYYLKTMDLGRYATGTTVPTLNRNHLDQIKVNIPDLAQQREIANKLNLFDEKISMLNDINDNLLDLSMTHFEHWLETTSSTNNVSLDEIATYKNGLAMQKFEPEDVADSLPVLKIRELNQGFTDSSSNRVRTDIDDSVKVYDGDVIFSWSGTLLVDIWTGGSAGLNQHLFKVTSTAYPKWFYYIWTRYHLRQFQQIAAGKATTMGHIKRGDLKSADVIIPTDSEFTQLETLLKPVVAAYIENGVEIKNLQTIRDQLLQKLLG